MDPLALRREYGRDLAFCGGIDKRALSRDRRAIEAEVHAKIPPMLEKGGFIPHLDHTFPPDIPYENFLYYMEMKEKVL
jgi:uroporphyrinogen decarboxylase